MFNTAFQSPSLMKWTLFHKICSQHLSLQLLSDAIVLHTQLNFNSKFRYFKLYQTKICYILIECCSGFSWDKVFSFMSIRVFSLFSKHIYKEENYFVVHSDYAWTLIWDWSPIRLSVIKAHTKRISLSQSTYILLCMNNRSRKEKTPTFQDHILKTNVWTS